MPEVVKGSGIQDSVVVLVRGSLFKLKHFYRCVHSRPKVLTNQNNLEQKNNLIILGNTVKLENGLRLTGVYVGLHEQARRWAE